MPRFPLALPVPGGGLTGGQVAVASLKYSLWWFYSSGIFLFWWPESQEVKDEMPECFVILSEAASLWASVSPKVNKRVGLGGVLGRYPLQLFPEGLQTAVRVWGKRVCGPRPMGL